MAPRVIVMLTHHDKTVENAMDVFKGCSDLPVQYWGLKDVGLAAPKTKELVKAFKDLGKTVIFEVVAYEEQDCLRSVDLAIECGIENLTGTVYYPSVLERLRQNKIRYYPFCGKRRNMPGVMVGTRAEIIAEGVRLQESGVDGINLIPFRHKEEDPVTLTREFMRQVHLPMIIAGSIDSYSRLDLMKDINPWGFTIGSAFFNGSFVPGGSFRNQVEAVVAYMQKDAGPDGR